jgi:hypothetical protein
MENVRGVFGLVQGMPHGRGKEGGLALPAGGVWPVRLRHGGHGFPVLGKIEIKYGFEWFEERNNFIHRNFFRLEMVFK